jgi:hypothetical protein
MAAKAWLSQQAEVMMMAVGTGVGRWRVSFCWQRRLATVVAGRRFVDNLLQSDLRAHAAKLYDVCMSCCMYVMYVVDSAIYSSNTIHTRKAASSANNFDCMLNCAVALWWRIRILPYPLKRTPDARDRLAVQNLHCRLHKDPGRREPAVDANTECFMLPSIYPIATDAIRTKIWRLVPGSVC